MDYLVKTFNSELLNNKNLELEITYHLENKSDIYKNLFKKLKELSSSIVIHEYIIIYYETNDKYKNIRVTKQFKDGNNLNKDIYMVKKSLAKPIKNRTSNNIIKNYNIKLNEEIIINSENINIKQLQNIKLIKIKLRLSFILKNNESYKIDLDLIKNINLQQNNIKEIKNRVFKKYNINNIIEDINYDLFDELILETEFFNNSLTLDDINNSIVQIFKLFEDNKILDYQNYIYLIATFIITNKYYLEDFKYKSGLKRLLNNVIEMNSELYYKKIYPEIENYYVTDKIDGQRCIVFIVENNNKFNIKLITNKLYQLNDYNEDLNISESKITILDSEMILNEELKNNTNIHSKDVSLFLFDIISYENNKLALNPFEERFPFINKGYEKIKFLSNIECKTYIKLTNNYKKELELFYKKERKYDIDGLIFTPNSKVKDLNSKYPINTNYNNMVGYKWKPIEEITIDFYIKKLPKNLYNTYPYNNYNLTSEEYIYILFSGITKYDFDKLNLNYMMNYKKIIPEIYFKTKLFPIQFSTSDEPNNYIYISKINNLDNNIGEFNYINNKWNLKKIRIDRIVELNRGEYFGNYYKISELIWNNIKNPLTFEMLMECNKCYFLNDNNTLYKAIRGFNSFVKSYILETITNPNLSDKNNLNWIIDLACGKGQDLNRINKLGFKNGLFIDNDNNALLELINRKHQIQTNHMSIYTQNINLTTNYKDIITNLDKFNIEKNSVDIIICNFAIHYIIKFEDNLNNLINLLNYYLKPNGRFIFTCFNGQKIFNLLENSNEWNLYEKDFLKYSIKKKYNSKSFINTGLEIDVLLPFSNTNYYTENLININYLTNTFNDNGYSTEISQSFNILLDIFKENNNKVYNELTKEDIEYLGLYEFIIVKKNYNNNIIIKSNLCTFFPCAIYKKEGMQEYDNENLNSLYHKLNHLDNIHNSKSILLVVNSTLDIINTNILNIFEDLNYKNKNIFKRNRIKIIKIITFDNFNLWFNIYNQYKHNNFTSIIFYDYNFKLEESNYKYLIKIPIMPIILNDNNNNNILIINNEDLNNFYKDKNYFMYSNYISNSNKNTFNYHNDQNIKLNIKSNKYFDIAFKE